jgi:hypothetical protein
MELLEAMLLRRAQVFYQSLQVLLRRWELVSLLLLLASLSYFCSCNMALAYMVTRSTGKTMQYLISGDDSLSLLIYYIKIYYQLNIQGRVSSVMISSCILSNKKVKWKV